MKKIKIKKSMKIGLGITISGLILYFIFMLLTVTMLDRTKEETIVLNAYTCKAETEYEALLKPNLLYDKTYLTSEDINITAYIDTISPKFKVLFHSDEIIPIEGDYTIIAKVEGSSGKGENYESIWYKDFELLPKTSFQIEDNKYEIIESIDVDLEKYNTFAEQVAEESKVSVSTRLELFMDVNITSNNNYGTIMETMRPSIIIPLKAAYFNVEGNLLEEKSGSHESVTEVELPLNNKLLALFIVLIIVGILLMVALILFTLTIKESQYEKMLKIIFKKYGSHLVAVTSNLLDDVEHYTTVHSIEDLVRLSEELSSPIMYIYSINQEDINEFFIYTQSKAYLYRINHGLTENLVEELMNDTNQDEVTEDIS